MPLSTRRKLIKFSNYSYCITLPKEAVSSMGWGKGEEVTVEFDEQAQLITITKNRRRQTKAVVSQTRPSTPQPVPKLRW